MTSLPRTIRAPYGRLEVELSDPLPDIDLAGPGGDWNGVHVLARWHGFPVGRCWLHRETMGPQVPAERLDAILGWETGARVTERRLQEALDPPGPDPLPALTMVVCTRNRAGLLARCLASLVALEHGGARPALMVIDNAPPDDATRDCVAGFPEVRYIREPLPGLDFARNRAIAECRTDYLAYIDDDATVDAGWLAAFAAAVRVHPDAGGFTGLVMPLQLETEAQIRFELSGGFSKGFTGWRYGPESWASPLYPASAGIFGTGANMAFRVETLRAIGGFDDALDTGAPLPGGGDLDIYYQVVRHGHPLIYGPGMLVFHEHRRDMPGLRKQYYTWGLGVMAVLRKNARDPAARRMHRDLLRWLIKFYVWQPLHLLRHGGAKPVSHALAEAWGAVVGYFGEYERSQRRIARRRAEFGE